MLTLAVTTVSLPVFLYGKLKIPPSLVLSVDISVIPCGHKHTVEPFFLCKQLPPFQQSHGSTMGLASTVAEKNNYFYLSIAGSVNVRR